MSLSGRAKKAAATAASVGLATSGLSSCTDNGAVDPPPPPFSCTVFDSPQVYQATASRTNLEVAVAINVPGAIVSWVTANASNVQNATVDSIILPSNPFEPPVVHLTIDSLTAPPVSFQLDATIRDADTGSGTSCNISRTFTVDVASLIVTVSMSRMLPLPVREQPQIVVTHRNGRHLELEAQSAHAAGTVSWDTTAGTISSEGNRGARWELPAEPGFYQVEVTMDYGDDGVGFDVLAVEVS